MLLLFAHVDVTLWDLRFLVWSKAVFFFFCWSCRFFSCAPSKVFGKRSAADEYLDTAFVATSFGTVQRIVKELKDLVVAREAPKFAPSCPPNAGSPRPPKQRPYAMFACIPGLVPLQLARCLEMPS
jgi:hypothetical protein